MYRPRFRAFHNPNFNQWSPQLNPRGPFLRRNFVTNCYRPQGPLTVQSNHEFWCETCDKGFQTIQILENHKSQHQKCNIDGCQFVAHPQVITKHIQMQHSTDLYKKIANLNNPEDIQKWREERKRKYPTKENIEKKVAEVKEKLERGEKMGIKYKSNNKRHMQGQPNRIKQNYAKGKYQQRHSHHNEKRCVNSKNPPPKKICKTNHISDKIYKLQAFAGIQQLVFEDESSPENPAELEDSLIEDDIFKEELTKNENTSTQLKPTVCGALLSLICNYGSSDEDNIPENPCPNNKDFQQYSEIKDERKVIAEDVKPVSLNNNDVKSDNDSGPDEVITKKEPIETNSLNEFCEKSKKNKTVKNERVNLRKIKKPKYHLPSTLLVKLLSREIEQERNIILQCVRFVVKNKFFDNTNIKE